MFHGLPAESFNLLEQTKILYKFCPEIPHLATNISTPPTKINELILSVIQKIPLYEYLY